MKPPPLTKKEILAGLKRAHARLLAAEAERREASERLAATPEGSPETEAVVTASFLAGERLNNELWRFVGAVEFHIGFRRTVP